MVKSITGDFFIYLFIWTTRYYQQAKFQHAKFEINIPWKKKQQTKTINSASVLRDRA